MVQIECPECSTLSEYSVDDGLVECKRCYAEFSPSDLTADLSSGEIVGLTLTYQTNQKRIEVPADLTTVLGREHVGDGVFSEIRPNDIPVISGKHCSIDFRDGRFYLKDENSTNGTFYSENKIPCYSPQVIEDNCVVFLGREMFHVKFRFKPLEELPEVHAPVEVSVTYRCNDANCQPEPYKTDKPFESCPKCGGFRNWIEIRSI